MPDQHSLRLALLAGSLGRGGAEKQCLYLARELVRAGVEVRVFALTHGDPYERSLEEVGAAVCWGGRYRVPLRIASLAGMVRAFRPDIVQALHFFTNLYAVAAARLSGCVEIGSIRNDTQFDMAECGPWGVPLLRAPRTLVSNSRAAAQRAERSGVRPERIQVLTNVIDVAEFDRIWAPCRVDAPSREVPIAIAVARLVSAKRLDRFLRALARARQQGIPLRGVIVGDGPERPGLEALAGALGLFPEGVVLLGEREDVPRLLARADMLVLTSQHEGFPNVLLEAMAAHLPVVTTTAGDAASLVRDGRTGFVVPFDDQELLCARLTELAVSPATRQALGRAGRRVIEEEYRTDTLAGRALRIYHQAARLQRCTDSMRALETLER
jgi:glycosyltransferase involved in cell wall biosynthesis